MIYIPCTIYYYIIVMEDSLSVKSNDSATTSDEYEFVNGTASGKGSDSHLISCAVAGGGLPQTKHQQPLLDISNGNLDDLKKCLGEVLSEENRPEFQEGKNCSRKKMDDNSESVAESSQETETSLSTHSVKHVPVTATVKKVGQSQFYSSSPVITTPSNSPSDDEEEAVPDVMQNGTIFSGIVSLGKANINAPRSEQEILRNMRILNREQGTAVIKVSLSVPNTSDGYVQLHDATGRFIAKYEVTLITYFTHGSAGTPEEACFAFTCPLGPRETSESTIFQCHVFRCDIPEAVGQVSKGFARAFNPHVPRSMTSSVTGDLGSNTSERNSNVYVFEVSLEIKEEDNRGGYSTVPKDRTCFKLRTNLSKQLHLSVQQVSDNEFDLRIEKCFGVLVSPGRRVKHSDMQLLEMVSMGSGSGDRQCCYISGQLDPADPAFELLNQETPRDQNCTYMTVAVDLVINGIQEPVRFLIETPIKVFPLTERFWQFTRRPLLQQFMLTLKEVPRVDSNDVDFELVSIRTTGELERNRRNLTLNLSGLIRSSDVDLESMTPKDDLSDGDEALLSGTGDVSKDCTEGELDSWNLVLQQWQSTQKRPKQLATLVKQSIPEALRGEVWQRLAGCENDNAMMDQYRTLITQDCVCENVIMRDINRTFPAHDFFKEAGGLGQDSLYRISKAYAVYDKEVGYCQGLSFLAASLLLHMPEEQAFCVLVKLMYDYGLRDMYKDGFENLYLRLYQLNKLMEEHLPQLWRHFSDMSVESHMFASQWFLTLFTARFPLNFVFHILDVFLLQGTETLFQVAIALLKLCKKDLLQLDFENIMRYFRVQMPKRCRTKEVSQQIMRLACGIKVKKLKKYEQDFIALKEEQDNADQCATEVEQLKQVLIRTEEEKKQLLQESIKVKEMLKREIAKAENESSRSATIISEYKQICQRMDMEQATAKAALCKLRNQVAECEHCSALTAAVSADIGISNSAEDLIEASNGSGDENLGRAQERIRELELELAKTKLAHVEAECTNQDLTHQLHAALIELQTTRNSWPPWLSKTLSSIKEAASGLPSGGSAMTLPRRESAPSSRSRPNSKLRTSSSVEWFIHEPITPSLASPPASISGSVSTNAVNVEPPVKNPSSPSE
ncbi:rab GTPase-activating protein 1-like isoform X2 [Frankliniella occidentalis]|uniref:Rab GTPase-activating protein 1-like isoform X2 n=1 Tax=Frankliniella occidentalis TaxID=133901 RepID=A0A9C6XDK2_FRAOC|nr:rab GTPase-activating protein 1-like isoform X2 [Frankliniella occidentalis]